MTCCLYVLTPSVPSDKIVATNQELISLYLGSLRIMLLPISHQTRTAVLAIASGNPRQTGPNCVNPLCRYQNDSLANTVAMPC